MGASGSSEGAQELLRNEAAKLDASYVQITSAEKPPINHQCQEHEHKLAGVAYRKPAAAAAGPSTAPPAPLLVQGYERSEPISKAAAATDYSSIALALVPTAPSGSALSVQYLCTGDDQRADLDVWSSPLVTDWSKARALSVRVKPSAAMSLSVSFMDGSHSGYTRHTETLVAGQWQTIVLPFDGFWLNPLGPPGRVQGAPQDRTRVEAFGFAPRGCNAGHFLIDDFALEN